MSNASDIIDKFGGQSALAKLLGKRQSTVQHWAKSGTIPAKWQGKLLELAHDHEIKLAPNDFMVCLEDRELEIVADKIPEAKHYGVLNFGDREVSCYVLDDGRRVISRTGATDVLTGKKGGGNLESYIGIKPLQKYISPEIVENMINFAIEGVVNKTIMGIEAGTFIEICRAYVTALDEGAIKTTSQISIAIKASMFLASCAKVGLIALIDEATGYQYIRAEDALQIKYKLYLKDEMRKWERTFPNELWYEFGRLTNWKGAVTQRPKYWGRLVMELVYDYMDKDIADWLRENAPKPQKGQNYHQWLTSQYGLRKLIEQIWMLIGMARSCQTMHELREKMAKLYNREPFQLSLFLPPIASLPKPIQKKEQKAPLNKPGQSLFEE